MHFFPLFFYFSLSLPSKIAIACLTFCWIWTFLSHFVLVNERLYKTKMRIWISNDAIFLISEFMITFFLDKKRQAFFLCFQFIRKWIRNWTVKAALKTRFYTPIQVIECKEFYESVLSMMVSSIKYLDYEACPYESFTLFQFFGLNFLCIYPKNYLIINCH